MATTNVEETSRLADAAVRMIEDGMVVGLGSGRAATAFVKALGQRIAGGLHVRGVPTSQATRDVAASVGIPLVGLDEVDAIDVAVDGADEVDPDLNLIKGRGGAMVREKIVAAAARRLVILVGREKIVAALGQHGVLPVEVVPFGLAPCRRALTQLGYPASSRRVDGQRFVTDNGNHILDCRVPPLADPMELERSIRAIPGVVGTGLFLGMADTVLVEDGDRIEVQTRNG
jgi:ribose 5-phosphate isomerase A